MSPLVLPGPRPSRHLMTSCRARSCPNLLFPSPCRDVCPAHMSHLKPKKKTGMTKIERVRSMTQGAPIAVLRDLGRRESFKSVKPHRASDPRPNRHILPGRSPTSMPPQRPTRPADFWRRRRLSTTISRAVSTPRLASFFAFSEASPFQPSQLRGVELLQHYLAWRGARCTK